MKKPFLQSLAIVVAIALAILARYFYPKAEFPQTELPTVSDQVEVEKLNSKSLSTCISDLKDIEAIKIDEAVKNCIHKEKIGQQPDGLGGLFSIIGIYNNTLVEIENEFYADVENAICMGTEINRQNPEEEIILYAAPAPEHYLEMYYDATTPDGEKNPLNQLNPIRAVIGKGLINEIPFLYPKSIYCNSGDEDC
ncbi:MAG: hypothetical protein LBI53_04040 [Candidatus Peribacteria bacterium]|jgi:hypothetical protein|nr:hypothetical protein [Candidatus Peribacteria bacterium]